MVTLEATFPGHMPSALPRATQGPATGALTLSGSVDRANGGNERPRVAGTALNLNPPVHTSKYFLWAVSKRRRRRVRRRRIHSVHSCDPDHEGSRAYLNAATPGLSVTSILKALLALPRTPSTLTSRVSSTFPVTSRNSNLSV